MNFFLNNLVCLRTWCFRSLAIPFLAFFFFWKCETSVWLWKLSHMPSVSKNPSMLSVMVWLENVSHGIVFGMCRPRSVFLSRKTVESLWGGPYLWKQVCRHADLKAITWPLALDTLCPCLSCCDMQLPLTALTALTSKPRGIKLSKTMNQNKSSFFFQIFLSDILS